MRGYTFVGLHCVKDVHNVGSVMRAAWNFGVRGVYFTGKRYRHAPTDTMHSSRHIPLTGVDDLHAVVPYDCVPVAVDLVDDAKNLAEYVHPERAFYIFGPEDGTLGNAVTGWCRDTIYIPTKNCMNLACAVHVVLYDRMVKRREFMCSEPKSLMGERKVI